MSTGQLSWPQQSSESNHPLQRWLSRGFLSALSVVILLGVMAAGYYATLTPVTIVVDGQARTVKTNQRLVENILREAGVKVAADDIVGPSLTESLADDQSTIIVQHARPVVVRADGRVQEFRSQTSLLEPRQDVNTRNTRPSGVAARCDECSRVRGASNSPLWRRVSLE